MLAHTLSAAAAVTSTLDFYIEVVNGLSVGNERPSISPLRVPPAFYCGEMNQVILRASDPQPASDIGH